MNEDESTTVRGKVILEKEIEDHGSEFAQTVLGSFEARGLAPGTYALVKIDDSDD